MTARIAVTQSRAEFAEEIEDLWRVIWADDVCTEAERWEFARLLGTNTTHWGREVLEKGFIVAFVGGGLDAAQNPDSRVSKLRREAERNGEDWARDLERLTA